MSFGQVLFALLVQRSAAVHHEHWDRDETQLMQDENVEQSAFVDGTKLESISK